LDDAIKAEVRFEAADTHMLLLLHGGVPPPQSANLAFFGIGARRLLWRHGGLHGALGGRRVCR
jgi:hypothetical protein